MNKRNLTVERLKELLHYEPATGVFTWKVRPCRNVFAGDVAGYRMSSGRIGICIDKVLYMANRLAFLYVTGAWPEKVIDHIDGDPANDRWANLREVTAKVNTQNQRRPQSRNLVGVLGVSRVANRFRAQIKVDGKNIYLGQYATPEEAHQVYLKAKRTMHEGCTL